ncbi:hypothetical protein QYM36_002047, partial [Artemia franciscana]
MEQFKRNFNSHLEESIRKHLVNVYTTLSMSTVACILGTYIQLLREIVTPEVGALFAFISLFGFVFVGSTKQMFGIRLSMLLVCSFSFGVSLAPVIQFVLLFNDPTIITTALAGTALIFIGFSLCSILSPSGKWLFLGAPLSTYLLSVTLLRLFMGGNFVLEMYIGLGVFCAYILYDTQLIIERKRMGEGDVLSHSLILFLDLVNVFVELLRILKDKDNKKKKISIIDTPQFQRLRNIKQLGGTYWVFPSSSHNRFEHSLGVCYLGGEMLEKIRSRQPELGITDSDILCVQIAGLCHDLGHGPFSHLWEHFMENANPEAVWKHEECSIKMLDFLIKKNELEDLFHKNDITSRDLIFIKELIVGPDSNIGDDWPYKGRDSDKAFLYEIIANKRNGVDVDKWDYFLRDAHALGLRTSFGYERLLQFVRVIDVPGEGRQ